MLSIKYIIIVVITSLQLVTMLQNEGRAEEVSYNSFDIEEFEKDCALMPGHLFGCMPFKCLTRSPDPSGGVVKNVILGLDQEKNCLHYQLSENGNNIECRYTEDSRKFLSLKMRKKSETPYMEQKELDKKLASDIFRYECEINGEKI